MKLTKTQKKFVKKNIRKKSLRDISKNLNIPLEDLGIHIKETWGKEKFNDLESPRDILRPQSIKYNKKLVFVFLAFLVFVCYLNSLGNDFVSDDIPIISANPQINNISYIFGPLIFNIRNTVIFLTNKLFGLDPMYFRLPNILLHLGVSYLLFILAAELVSETVGL
ncbi:hypothetical protein COV27_03045, partial [candidate division WWE3 bacterium CG10_big_fil_rev_8_21_14_0_10_39_14]